MQAMSWSDIGKAQPLRMASVLRFMERFKNGSAASVRGASKAQIAELVRPLAGGRASLPTIYVDFLETMGENSNGIRLVWGSNSASRLLADRLDDSEPHVNPNRYFKYGIGELEDVGERPPDGFLDLAEMTADGADAAILEIREGSLVRGKEVPTRPYASFSDKIRANVVRRFCLDANPKREATAFSFGELASASSRVVEFLGKLGFFLTELGASPAIVPMENPERGTVALLFCRNPGYWPRTHLSLYSPDEEYDKYLRELVADNRAMLAPMPVT